MATKNHSEMEEVFNEDLLEAESFAGTSVEPDGEQDTLERLPASSFYPQLILGDSAAAQDVGSEAAQGEFLRDAYFGSFDDAEPGAKSTGSAEVIIGTDNRIRINPTTSFPWRAICALRIRAASGATYIGTGWFISPRTVMTAGHCVFLHNEGGWARSIEVIPALNGTLRPYGSCTSSAFRSVSGWTSSRNRNFDYGCIILPSSCRLGARTGWFGFANRSDSFLRSRTLNLSGYPGDKGGNTQWYHAQRTKSVTPRTIVYDIDTMGGQSGSPVWYLDGNTRYAVGVHTNGHSSGNSATRIVSDVFTMMQSWKALGA